MENSDTEISIKGSKIVEGFWNSLWIIAVWVLLQVSLTAPAWEPTGNHPPPPQSTSIGRGNIQHTSGLNQPRVLRNPPLFTTPESEGFDPPFGEAASDRIAGH